MGGGAVDGEQGGRAGGAGSPSPPQGSAPLHARGSAHPPGLSAQLQLVLPCTPASAVMWSPVPSTLAEKGTLLSKFFRRYYQFLKLHTSTH